MFDKVPFGLHSLKNEELGKLENSKYPPNHKVNRTQNPILHSSVVQQPYIVLDTYSWHHGNWYREQYEGYAGAYRLDFSIPTGTEENPLSAFSPVIRFPHKKYPNQRKSHLHLFHSQKVIYLTKDSK